jgi:hypothetical protein
MCGQVALRFEENKSLTLDETIAAYTYLDGTYDNARLETAGTTDSGKPLHVFMIDRHKEFDPEKAKARNKRILFVNNGIHPGESCGIDASVFWTEQLLKNDDPLLENTVVIIIPVYNTGGMLNQHCCFRANQNGPESHGFRGNAQNLDLNRDFIKCDSENARSFTRLFQRWSPDVFVDTHTTNGSDHQHTMTIIAPNKHKMNTLQGSLAEKDLIPFLYKKMAEGGYDMAPYVFSKGETPESGILHFCDSPRYASGYANLFHSLGFTAEAHMLKPYADRVKATALLLQSLLEMTNTYSDLIAQMRRKAIESTANGKNVALNHRVDTTTHDLFRFKGYESVRRISPVTGLEQNYYHSDAPYEKDIPYYNRLNPELSVSLPEYYIIPQSWKKVVELIKLNGVEVKQLSSDMELEVTVHYIENYNTVSAPYEGHYLHREVSTRTVQDALQFYSGDYIIRCNQGTNQYIASVLDPRSEDSFFCWNFFDAILMQKEYFSPYLFDAEAEKLLEENPDLKARFLTKKKDPEFAENAWAQLYFIYQRSPWYEKTHNRYPVFEFNGKLNKAILE